MAALPVALVTTIGRFLTAVKQRYEITAAYLYGSQAKGAATAWSDIDLAIISPDFSADLFQEQLNLLRLAAQIDDRIEPRPFRPEDFNASDPLVNEIQQTGLRVAGSKLAPKVLNEIIQRIVKVAAPEKIILFGSAAREEVGLNSDVDLLVIKAGAHRRQLTQAIYMNLFGVGQAVDVIVVTPEDVERYQDSLALVIEPALREGKVVYAS